MKRKAITDEIKDQVGRSCANCGATDDLQYHHIVPLALGGNDIVSNMVCLCARCHWVIHQGAAPSFDHGECVKAGIARAKARGTHFGTKQADYERVMKLIVRNSTHFNPFSEMAEREIKELAGVSQTTYYKCKRMLFDAMSAETWPYSFEKPTTMFEHPADLRIIRRNRGW